MPLAAQTESIIVDPTHTAKLMSALIAEIRKGNIAPNTPIIFIHSGGTPQNLRLHKSDLKLCAHPATRR